MRLVSIVVLVQRPQFIIYGIAKQQRRYGNTVFFTMCINHGRNQGLCVYDEIFGPINESVSNFVALSCIITIKMVVTEIVDQEGYI